MQNKNLDAEAKADIEKKLEALKKQKLNNKVESNKKDLAQDFSYNFYDRLIDHD